MDALDAMECQGVQARQTGWRLDIQTGQEA
jgi:hypothetical protein